MTVRHVGPGLSGVWRVALFGVWLGAEDVRAEVPTSIETLALNAGANVVSDVWSMAVPGGSIVVVVRSLPIGVDLTAWRVSDPAQPVWQAVGAWREVERFGNLGYTAGGEWVYGWLLVSTADGRDEQVRASPWSTALDLAAGLPPVVDQTYSLYDLSTRPPLKGSMYRGQYVGAAWSWRAFETRDGERWGPVVFPNAPTEVGDFVRLAHGQVALKDAADTDSDGVRGEWQTYALTSSGGWAPASLPDAPAQIQAVWRHPTGAVVGLQDLGDSNANGEAGEWRWWLRDRKGAWLQAATALPDFPAGADSARLSDDGRFLALRATGTEEKSSGWRCYLDDGKGWVPAAAALPGAPTHPTDVRLLEGSAGVGLQRDAPDASGRSLEWHWRVRGADGRLVPLASALPDAPDAIWEVVARGGGQILGVHTWPEDRWSWYHQGAEGRWRPLPEALGAPGADIVDVKSEGRSRAVGIRRAASALTRGVTDLAAGVGGLIAAAPSPSAGSAGTWSWFLPVGGALRELHEVLPGLPDGGVASVDHGELNTLGVTMEGAAGQIWYILGNDGAWYPVAPRVGLSPRADAASATRWQEITAAPDQPWIVLNGAAGRSAAVPRYLVAGPDNRWVDAAAALDAPRTQGTLVGLRSEGQGRIVGAAWEGEDHRMEWTWHQRSAGGGWEVLATPPKARAVRAARELVAGSGLALQELGDANADGDFESWSWWLRDRRGRWRELDDAVAGLPPERDAIFGLLDGAVLVVHERKDSNANGLSEEILGYARDRRGRWKPLAELAGLSGARSELRALPGDAAVALGSDGYLFEAAPGRWERLPVDAGSVTEARRVPGGGVAVHGSDGWRLLARGENAAPSALRGGPAVAADLVTSTRLGVLGLRASGEPGESAWTLWFGRVRLRPAREVLPSVPGEIRDVRIFEDAGLVAIQEGGAGEERWRWYRVGAAGDEGKWAEVGRSGGLSLLPWSWSSAGGGAAFEGAVHVLDGRAVTSVPVPEAWLVGSGPADVAGLAYRAPEEVPLGVVALGVGKKVQEILYESGGKRFVVAVGAGGLERRSIPIGGVETAVIWNALGDGRARVFREEEPTRWLYWFEDGAGGWVWYDETGAFEASAPELARTLLVAEGISAWTLADRASSLARTGLLEERLGGTGVAP